MINRPTYDQFLFEDDKSATENRISKLSKDPKVQKAMGTNNVKNLKQAFMTLFKRGYGAAQTNWGAVNPNIKKLGKPAAYNAWGYARLNAFIDKRTAYKTSDKDVADWLKGKSPKPESISESKDHEIEMAMSQLERCIDYATMLRERLPEWQELPAWLQSKLTMAQYNLQSAFNYIDGKDGVVEGAEDDPRETGLFSEPGPGAVKGTGYKDKETAEKSIVILDKLKKKDFKHAMSIATTMLNRAATHKHQTPDMKQAMKVYRKWIDANKKS